VDIDEAERVLLDAVRRAMAAFLARVRGTVFADLSNPDFLVWPSDAWALVVAEFVTPVAAELFRRVLADHGVTDPVVVDSAVATFVAQDLAPVVNATTIPDETQSVLFEAAVAGAVVGLLTASAARWQPMLGVMAVNGGASAVNAADFVAGRLLSDFGRRDVTKRWIARDDEKTRPTHVTVDNTTVSVNDVFIVGGFPLRYPHDPFGPIQEVVNCRCRLRYGVRND